MQTRGRTLFKITPFLKTVALFTLHLFVLTQCIILPSPGFAQDSGIRGKDPVTVQTGRVPGGLIAIPSGLGTVDEIYFPEAKNRPQSGAQKTIVFIQDAHDSLEAQEHIAKIIEHLVSDYGVRTVFEEGYEGPVPTDDFFGFIEEPELRRKVSYFFMDHLRIGGAEFSHINRGLDFNLIGADSHNLHLKNIRQYRVSAAKKDAIAKDLTALENELKRLINKSFPRPLREWLRLKNRYDAKELDFFSYLERTMRLWNPGDQVNAAWPLIRFIFEAAKSKDPVILEKAKRIDAREVYREIRKLEEAVAEAYLNDTADKQLFEYYRTLTLLARLNHLEVTQEEYQAVKAEIEAFDTDSFARFIFSQSPRTLILSRQWEANILEAVKFYEIAAERDRAVSRALDRYFLDSEADSAVLVYGGFHKENIKRILEAKGLSYLVVSPRITKSSTRHQQFYKRLMTEGMHPFERAIAPALARAARPLSLIAKPEAVARAEVRKIYDLARRYPDYPETWDRRIAKNLVRSETGAAALLSDRASSGTAGDRRLSSPRSEIRADRPAPSIRRAVHAGPPERSRVSWGEKRKLLFSITPEQMTVVYKPQGLPAWKLETAELKVGVGLPDHEEGLVILTESEEALNSLMNKDVQSQEVTYEITFRSSDAAVRISEEMVASRFHDEPEILIEWSPGFDLHGSQGSLVFMGSAGKLARVVDWFKSEGYSVIRQKRTSFGASSIEPELREGESRKMSWEELIGLMQAVDVPEFRDMNSLYKVTVAEEQIDREILKALLEREDFIKEIFESLFARPDLGISRIAWYDMWYLGEGGFRRVYHVNLRIAGESKDYSFVFKVVKERVLYSDSGFVYNEKYMEELESVLGRIRKKDLSLYPPFTRHRVVVDSGGRKRIAVAEGLVPLEVVPEEHIARRLALEAYFKMFLIFDGDVFPKDPKVANTVPGSDHRGRLNATIVDLDNIYGPGVKADRREYPEGYDEWVPGMEVEAISDLLGFGYSAEEIIGAAVSILGAEKAEEISKDFLTRSDFIRAATLHDFKATRYKNAPQGRRTAPKPLLSYAADPVKISINGLVREVPAAASLAAILLDMHVSPESDAVIELNGRRIADEDNGWDDRAFNQPIWDLLSPAYGRPGIKEARIRFSFEHLDPDEKNIFHELLEERDFYGYLDELIKDLDNLKKSMGYAAEQDDKLRAALVLLSVLVKNQVRLRRNKQSIRQTQQRLLNLRQFRRLAHLAGKVDFRNKGDRRDFMLEYLERVRIGSERLREIYNEVSDGIRSARGEENAETAWAVPRASIAENRKSRVPGQGPRTDTGRSEVRVGDDKTQDLAHPSGFDEYLSEARRRLEAIDFFAARPRMIELLLAQAEFKYQREDADKTLVRGSTGGIFLATPLETVLDLAEKFELKPGRRVLEVGSGDGMTAFLIAELTGAQVTGIEIDPVRFQIGKDFEKFLKEEKQLEWPGVTLIQGDFLDHPVSGYDLIYFYFTVPDKDAHRFPYRVLEKLEHELAPGSVFVSPAFYLSEELKGRYILSPDEVSVRAERISEWAPNLEYEPMRLRGIEMHKAAVLRRARQELRSNEIFQQARSEMRKEGRQEGVVTETVRMTKEEFEVLRRKVLAAAARDFPVIYEVGHGAVRMLFDQIREAGFEGQYAGVDRRDFPSFLPYKDEAASDWARRGKLLFLTGNILDPDFHIPVDTIDPQSPSLVVTHRLMDALEGLVSNSIFLRENPNPVLLQKDNERLAERFAAYDVPVQAHFWPGGKFNGWKNEMPEKGWRVLVFQIPAAHFRDEWEDVLWIMVNLNHKDVPAAWNSFLEDEIEPLVKKTPARAVGRLELREDHAEKIREILRASPGEHKGGLLAEWIRGNPEVLETVRGLWDRRNFLSPRVTYTLEKQNKKGPATQVFFDLGLGKLTLLALAGRSLVHEEYSFERFDRDVSAAEFFKTKLTQIGGAEKTAGQILEEQGFHAVLSGELGLEHGIGFNFDSQAGILKAWPFSENDPSVTVKVKFKEDGSWEGTALKRSRFLMTVDRQLQLAKEEQVFTFHVHPDDDDRPSPGDLWIMAYNGGVPQWIAASSRESRLWVPKDLRRLKHRIHDLKERIDSMSDQEILDEAEAIRTETLLSFPMDVFAEDQTEFDAAVGPGHVRDRAMLSAPVFAAMESALDRQKAVLAGIPLVQEFQSELPGTLLRNDMTDVWSKNQDPMWKHANFPEIDSASRIASEGEGQRLSPGDPFFSTQLDRLVERPAKKKVIDILRLGGETIWSNAFGPGPKGIRWTKDGVHYFSPLERDDYSEFVVDFRAEARSDHAGFSSLEEAAIKLKNTFPENRQIGQDLVNFAKALDRRGIRPGQRWMDLGPGPYGYAGLLLAIFGCEVDVVEPKPESMSYYKYDVNTFGRSFYGDDQEAAARFLSRIRFFEVPLSEFSEPDTRTYDGVIAANILDLFLLDNDVEELNALWRLLEARALLYISSQIPNRSSGPRYALFSDEKERAMQASAAQAGVRLLLEPSQEDFGSLKGKTNFWGTAQKNPVRSEARHDGAGAGKSHPIRGYLMNEDNGVWIWNDQGEEESTGVVRDYFGTIEFNSGKGVLIDLETYPGTKLKTGHLVDCTAIGIKIRNRYLGSHHMLVDPRQNRLSLADHIRIVHDKLLAEGFDLSEVSYFVDYRGDGAYPDLSGQEEELVRLRFPEAAIDFHSRWADGGESENDMTVTETEIEIAEFSKNRETHLGVVRYEWPGFAGDQEPEDRAGKRRQGLLVERDVVFVVPSSVIRALTPPEMRELILLAGLNKKLHIVVPDGLETHDERIEELRRIGNVYHGFSGIAHLDAPVVGFGDMDAQTAEQLKREWDPELVRRISFCWGMRHVRTSSGQAGNSFGVPLFAAIGDISMEALGESNGFLYDPEGRFIDWSRSELRAYTVISTSA